MTCCGMRVMYHDKRLQGNDSHSCTWAPPGVDTQSKNKTQVSNEEKIPAKAHHQCCCQVQLIHQCDTWSSFRAKFTVSGFTDSQKTRGQVRFA